jgi:predicted  nucleic acid-binding Zn-ribbon protein
MSFLQTRDPLGNWDVKLQRYAELRTGLMVLRQEAMPLHTEVQHAYAQLASLRKQRADAQTLMGAHFRSVSDWTTQALVKRADFGNQISAIDYEIRELRRHVISLKEDITAIEKGTVAQQLRADLDAIERDAEMARLKIVRNALLTSDGLPHTNHRPSAWWLPMVDSTGAWFRKIADTAHYYTEPLLTQK